MHRPKRPRAWRLLCWGIATVAVGGTTLAPAQSAPIEFLCPTCYGFERLSGNVFVERSASPSQRKQLTEAVAEAEARVARFLGQLRSSPTILACFTDACSLRVGFRGEKGRAFGAFLLELAPTGLNTVIIAHERTHIEFHDRIGLIPCRLRAGLVRRGTRRRRL